MAKINAAYNDGPQKVVDMLKADFNIDINHYLEVNFIAFERLVDAIGTVGVYFPAPTRDYDTAQQGDTGFLVDTPGCVQLTGDPRVAVRARAAHAATRSHDGQVDVGRPHPRHRPHRTPAVVREEARHASRCTACSPTRCSPSTCATAWCRRSPPIPASTVPRSTSSCARSSRSRRTRTRCSSTRCRGPTAPARPASRCST